MQTGRQKILTFVFTDLTDSTRLWDTLPYLMPLNLQELTQIVQSLASEHDGELFKTVGDEFCLAFESTDSAVAFSQELHKSVASHPWPIETPLQLKTAVHLGHAHPIDGDYLGPALNEVARLLSLARPNDIVISESAKVALALKPALQYLGKKKARGLSQPISAYLVSDSNLPRPLLQMGLPRDSASFFGRKTELSDLHTLIDQKTPLITVTGIGGIGKTTLCLKTIRLAQESSQKLFVDCTSFESGEDILAGILSALESDAVTTGRLSEIELIISDRPVLLLLDCFENLVPNRQVITDLLNACSNLQILISSRVVLGLDVEHEYPLQPLNLSSPEASSELFFDTAQKKGSAIENTPEVKKVVSNICESLDHIPLAIILAASRLRTISIAELQQRIKSRRTDTLADHNAQKPKHASLLQTVRDSIALLPESAANTLFHIAHFPGGFLISDATTILQRNVDDFETDLQILRDHSLVVARAQNDKTRFVLLDSIRDAALNQPNPELLKRHADHYANLSRTAYEARQTTELKTARQSLISELANVRQSLAFAKANNDPTLQVAIQVGLLPALLETGHFDDFLESAQSTAKLAAELKDIDALLAALGTEGAFWFFQKMPSKGIETWQERLQIALSHHRNLVALDTLLDLAEHELGKGNHSGALPYLDKAEKLINLPDCLTLKATYYAILLNNPDPSINQGALQTYSDQADVALQFANNHNHRGYVLLALSNYYQSVNQFENAENSLIKLLVEGADLGHFAQCHLAALGLANCAIETSQDASTSLALALALLEVTGDRFFEKTTTVLNQVEATNPDQAQRAQTLKNLSLTSLCRTITPCNPTFPER